MRLALTLVLVGVAVSIVLLTAGQNGPRVVGETAIAVPTSTLSPSPIPEPVPVPTPITAPTPEHGPTPDPIFTPAAEAASSSAQTPALPQDTAAPVEPIRVSLTDGRVSIQTAAQRLCAQAGMVYDFTRSRTNADPDCRRYVAVNVRDLTLAEALDEVVTRNGLRWVMKERSVWLER